MTHAAIEFLLWLLGLCVGSFLNVVVYRLNAGLSVARPARSFCPHCRTAIAWYDNIPVLSWILLRGRCRHCARPISVQYPLIEAGTALVFVLAYHLLFVRHARDGLAPPALPADLPLLAAWLALGACLVACTALDLFSYSIDVRVTNVTIAAGVIAHAVWPRADLLVGTAASSSAAGAVAALLAGVLLWRLLSPYPALNAVDLGAPEEAPPAEPAPARAARLAGMTGTAVFVLLAAGLMLAAAAQPRAGMAVPAALVALFAALVIASGQRRTADVEIHAAIEDERPLARRVALRELGLLLLAGAIGGAIGMLLHHNSAAGGAWRAAAGWSPGFGLAPLGGAAAALYGAALAAVAGWILRVFFTLVYGREAFGVGDIYILAAAGATAGWDIALLGLLLSVGLALAGWLIGLLLKTCVMIQFGPWLALGFLAALWCNRPAAQLARQYAEGIILAWQEHPQLLATLGGLLLVGSAVAIVAARILRNWLAPDSPTEN